MSNKTWNRILVRTLLATIVSGGLVACSNDSPEKLLASAKSYVQANQPDAAVIQLNNALQKRPNFGEARYLLGKLMFDKGDTTAAVTELGKANDLRYSPDDVIPLLAKALLRAGEPAKVIARTTPTLSLADTLTVTRPLTLALASGAEIAGTFSRSCSTGSVSRAGPDQGEPVSLVLPEASGYSPDRESG